MRQREKGCYPAQGLVLFLRFGFPVELQTPGDGTEPVLVCKPFDRFQPATSTFTFSEPDKERWRTSKGERQVKTVGRESASFHFSISLSLVHCGVLLPRAAGSL